MASVPEQADFDNSLRLYTYRRMVETGRAPAVATAAKEMGSTEAAVRAAYARLSHSHAFMLTEIGELWRVAPFSAIPTPFPVKSGGQTYYANCIWDALGIPAMLGQDATIPASCACCNLEMTLQVKGGSLLPHEGLIHVAVSARRWYEDVVFT
ncbi:MAG TPA: organomercurial lyase [Terriglobales bacterium]|nr:organomercurial lyase [Terriglobales bacterium]